MSATKVHVLFLICFIIVFLASLCQAAPRRENRKITKENYSDGSFERLLPTRLDDELANMRDDLIQRKNNRRGFVNHHNSKAWSTRGWYSNGWNDDE